MVVGTGAIGAFIKTGDEIEAQFCMTEDIDVCLARGKKSRLPLEDLLEKSSEFHAKNNFYVEILDDYLIQSLPPGWQQRGKTYHLENGVVGIALAPIDVASNKLIACRAKDIPAIIGMIENGLFTREQLRVIHMPMIESNYNGLGQKLREANEILDVCLLRGTELYRERFLACLESHRFTQEPLIMGLTGIEQSALNSDEREECNRAHERFRLDGDAENYFNAIKSYMPRMALDALDRDI